MRYCECCGEEFKSKEVEVKRCDNTLQALCAIVGSYIYESVCEKPECQKYAQYQCDMFDQARKGE